MLLLLLNESFSVQSLYWLVQRKFQLSYFDNEFKLDQVSALILQYTFREIKIYFVPVEDDSVQFSFKGRYLKNLCFPTSCRTIQAPYKAYKFTWPSPYLPLLSLLTCCVPVSWALLCPLTTLGFFLPYALYKALLYPLVCSELPLFQWLALPIIQL